MFAELFNKKILFVSGKGGTGKSAVSALLGLFAAQSGKRVLLAESHAFDKLAPLFGSVPVGHHETELLPKLSCINLDPKRCFAEYVQTHLGLESLYERVFKSQPVRSLLDAIPGLDETMVLGRLFYTCELSKTSRYDLVIVDSPASGHFLKVMSTPDAIIQTGLGGPLVREVERVKHFLRNPQKAAGVVVCIPEDLVMTETLEFLPKFGSTIPLHLASVILNRAYSYPPAQFSNAIQKYFVRKHDATAKAKAEILQFATEHSQQVHSAYMFPDLELMAEPLNLQKLSDITPLIEELHLASQAS